MELRCIVFQVSTALLFDPLKYRHFIVCKVYWILAKITGQRAPLCSLPAAVLKINFHIFSDNENYLLRANDVTTQRVYSQDSNDFAQIHVTLTDVFAAFRNQCNNGKKNLKSPFLDVETKHCPLQKSLDGLRWS